MAGIIWWILNKEGRIRGICKKGGILGEGVRVFSYIGEATYHIFLVQQVWFALNMYNKWGGPMGLIQDSLLDLGVCIILGCMFYSTEKKIRRFLT